MTDGHMLIPMTRTRAGKKIDTWTFAMPDDTRIDIDVAMHSSWSRIDFEAHSKHSLLRGMEWRHSDLDVLRQTVHDQVAEIVGEVLDTQWQKALLVETSEYDLGDKETRRFGLTISCEHIRVAIDEPPSNLGERRAIQKGRRTVVAERAHDDALPNDSSPSARSIRVLDGEGKSRIAVPDTPETRARLDAIEATLKRFTTALMDRMSPKTPGERLPSPEDMAEMMRIAAENERK